MPHLIWVLLVLQVLTWVLSYDGEQSPEPLAITAAGAALAVSGEFSLQTPTLWVWLCNSNFVKSQVLVKVVPLCR